jgi:sugar phosphate isomerase/epimerase
MALKGHPNFGVCADLGHWPKSGIVPLDAVKKLSGHILAVHLKDIAAYNDPTLKDVVVGTGVVKFPEIFAELKKQNFNGYIYIERDSIEPHGNLTSVKQEEKYYNDQVSNLK